MALKKGKYAEKKRDITSIEIKIVWTGRKQCKQCLPYAGMETGQPSTCSIHIGHSLGNSIGDPRNTCLSVGFEHKNVNIKDNNILRLQQKICFCIWQTRDFRD